jgi:molybdopterin-containing oxidoreductase family iron-sulfur binding subunit
MKITRKEFLQILGGSAVAAGAAGLLHAVRGPSAMPSQPVGRKQRWGMAIDFQKCRADKGCDDCLRACHSVHNVPQIPDPAHEVKWIWKEPYEKVFPFQQTDYTRQTFSGNPLPILCNHCASPPCVRVCPTQATWKRDDGIVMMDYHRCIGCRYCMAACPYGSRSFNWFDPRPYISKQTSGYATRTKGVVEKCNFCEERLADGLLPACVEACSQKALVFGDLNTEGSEVRQVLGKHYSIQRRPELGCGPSIFYLI